MQLSAACQRSAAPRRYIQSQHASQPLRPGVPASLQGSRTRCTTRVAAQADSASSEGNTNPLDFEELTEIVRMVNSTDVVELELKSKRFSLSMRKKEAIAAPEPPQVQYVSAPQQQPQQFARQQFQPQGDFQQQQPQQQQQFQQQQPQQQQTAPADGDDGGGGIDGTELLSPMGGTYYRSPAPGEAPFVREGDKVTKGQTVGIIEAMKLMNEIEAEVTGTVVKLVVDNGSPVTPGQTLLIIKPE